MNKKLSTKFADSIRDAVLSMRNRAKEFLDEYDIASAPSFFIFMVVITAGLTVNYYFLAPQVGAVEAIAISLLFEIGIFAWKLQGHRIKNSEAQAEIVNWCTWISTALAFAMLVASLTQRINWGWVVACAAMTHAVGFLLFDQNDVIRTNKRKNRMAFERIGQKEIDSTNAISEAEADLKIIHKIISELERLGAQYRHLPAEQLEFVLEETRKRLLKEYQAGQGVDDATKGLSDINKDGVIGSPRMHAFASKTNDNTRHPS